MSTSMQQTPIRRIDGSDTSLEAFRGKVLLIVNVASKCGLTPQYEALEKLYQTYRDRGFEVLGFPANEFAGQEPGSNAEIEEFCQSNYGVSFPLFEKIVVKGERQHPLYRQLTAARPQRTEQPGSGFRAKLEGYGFTPQNEADVLWNFEKFLLNRQGEVVERFAPDVAPDSPLLIEAVEAQLAQD